MQHNNLTGQQLVQQLTPQDGEELLAMLNTKIRQIFDYDLHMVGRRRPARPTRTRSIIIPHCVWKMQLWPKFTPEEKVKGPLYFFFCFVFFFFIIIFVYY